MDLIWKMCLELKQSFLHFAVFNTYRKKNILD